jgi:predicted acyltransferase (DUF342 family)
MKTKIRRGNILITFILISFLGVVAFSLFFVMSGRLKSVTGQSQYVQALYLAEAGVDKAVWYLLTSPSEGGRGSSWRTGGETEQFGEGQYTMIVENHISGDVLITASGEVEGVVRSIQVMLTASELPVAFDYALFNNGTLDVSGSVSITGDIYADGDATINNPAEVSGEVFVPEENTVSGDGEYSVGDPPEDPPEMPLLDTAYYDGQISLAGLEPSGDLALEDYTLGEDEIIYVNGNVIIRGALTGSGKIVATGDITFEGTTTDPDIEYISGDNLFVTGNSNVGESLIYSTNDMEITGNPRIEGTIMAESIIIAGTPSIFGIVYSTDISSTLGTANIYGSVVNPTNSSLTGNVSIVYDPAYLPATPPPGMTAGDYDIVDGSWKEL